MQLDETGIQRIRQHQPRLRSHRALITAAVAVIVRDSGQGSEFLMMQRARHQSDPWSGQMAFPGGKIEADDASAMHAAIRETQEEVGVDLHESELLGQLDDVYGMKVNHQFTVHVSSYVFKIDRPVNTLGNHEVADIVWVPFSLLNDPNKSHPIEHPKDPDVRVPGVLLNEAKEQIIWGLSLRVLINLYQLIDAPLSSLDEEGLNIMLNFENTNLKVQN